MKNLILLPTLLKSLFYQANWNVKNMQGTGFSWLVKGLFRDNNIKLPEDFKPQEPVYFNTNPYLITFILGMLLRESEDNGKVGDYQNTYASAFAALGDSFFWHSLRPFTFFLSIWAAMIAPIFAIFLYLVVYNLFHFGFRFLGFYYGYLFGRNVILVFRRIAFNKWTFVFDSCSMFMAGAAIGWAIRFQVATDTISAFKAAILFLIGVFVARRVNAAVGFMGAALVLGLMLMVGV